MIDIKDIRELLANALVAGPADRETIHSAETILGIQFPPSYRAFLSEFGAAIGEGFDIAGLFQDDDDDGPPLWSDVISRTRRLRTPPGSIPASYIPVSSDGVDCMFYIDTSRPNQAGECPVIVLGPGVDEVIIAPDFFHFVDRIVKHTLSY